MKVLQLIILCLFGNVVFGLRNGGPPRACDHMQPGHKRSESTRLPLISRQLLNRTPYEVKAETHGSYVRLTVNGSANIQGFLIQARLTEKGPAIGQFKLKSQSENFIAKHQDCAEKGVIISFVQHYNKYLLPPNRF